MQPWLSRARHAAANSSYRVEGEISLPAPLPGWIKLDSCPAMHVDAMLAAARALGGRLDAAFGTMASPGEAPDRTRRYAERIRGLAAAAQTDVAYATGLHDADTSDEISKIIEEHLHWGLGTQFQLGQALAMPYLVERVHKVARPTSSAPIAWPGQPGFDPWCLTDPDLRARPDPDAQRAVADLWRYDPDPVRTVKIQRRIESALRSRQIRSARQADGTPLGAYYCCPWPRIHELLRPVRFAGQRLAPLSLFTFYVSADELAKIGVFVRRILIGPFRESSKIDYRVGPAGDDD